MRGNAFHLAVLIGDRAVFDYLLDKLRSHISESELARIKAEAGGMDDEGETKGEVNGGCGDVNLDEFTNAIIATMAAATGAPLTVGESTTVAAIIRKGKGDGLTADDCQLQEGSKFSITSSLYDVEVAKICAQALGEGRSEARLTVGRYNLLQLATAFCEDENADLVSGLLHHKQNFREYDNLHFIINLRRYSMNYVPVQKSHRKTKHGGTITAPPCS